MPPAAGLSLHDQPMADTSRVTVLLLKNSSKAQRQDREQVTETTSGFRGQPCLEKMFLGGHTNQVSRMTVDEHGQLVSCSMDDTVRYTNLTLRDYR